MHSRSGAGAALRNPQRSGIPRHRADRVPEDLPLFPEPPRKAYALPHITAARARGLGEIRILAWHVLPVAGPQMIALAGITVSIALGASIPVESPLRTARASASSPGRLRSPEIFLYWLTLRCWLRW